MKKFKDIDLMTKQMMMTEYSEIFFTYEKIISMPTEIIERVNVLMDEIQKKELIEKQEALKTEYQKALEVKNLTEKEEFKEEMALRNELVGLNINYMRQKYFNSNSGGRKKRK